jgi:hypothetical protein
MSGRLASVVIRSCQRNIPNYPNREMRAFCDNGFGCPGWGLAGSACKQAVMAASRADTEPLTRNTV